MAGVSSRGRSISGFSTVRMRLSQVVCELARGQDLLSGAGTGILLAALGAALGGPGGGPLAF